MKRFILYYRIPGMKIMQRVYCYSTDEARDVVASLGVTEYKIFDTYKAEFVDLVENRSK